MHLQVVPQGNDSSFMVSYIGTPWTMNLTILLINDMLHNSKQDHKGIKTRCNRPFGLDATIMASTRIYGSMKNMTRTNRFSNTETNLLIGITRIIDLPDIHAILTLEFGSYFNIKSRVWISNRPVHVAWKNSPLGRCIL